MYEDSSHLDNAIEQRLATPSSTQTSRPQPDPDAAMRDYFELAQRTASTVMDAVFTQMRLDSFAPHTHKDDGIVLHCEDDQTLDEGVSVMPRKLIKQRIEIGDTVKWVTGYTQQDILVAAAELLLESGVIGPKKPISQPGDDVLFQPYAEKWLRLYKSKKAHTTQSTWKSMFRKHLFPFFGECKVKEITIDQVQEFMNSKESYSRKSIHEMRLLLGMIMESAREDGLITINPARASHLSNPSEKKMVRVPLTRAQALDIIANLHRLFYAQDRMYVALLLYTGMRRGEVLGLRGEDIDFENRLIHVRRNVTFDGNRPLVHATKTEAGVRDIPIHPDLLAYLPSPLEEGIYLIGHKETPVTTTQVRNTWIRITGTLNVYDKTPHYFRHTFVTFARRAGVEEKTLQTIGGYADIETMRNVYTHTQEEDIDAARYALEQMFV